MTSPEEHSCYWRCWPGCPRSGRTIRHGAISDLADALASIREFLEKVYNQKRLHSARLPASWRVRAKPQGGRCAAAFCMSFPRHRKIFPSDGSAGITANAPTHRLDEFPAGYSLAGWSPPEPASASPAANQYALQSSCRSSPFHRTANSVLTVCVSRGGKRILAILVQG
jgi:hypothetical protein